MAALKALLIAGLVTLGITLIVFWILPVITFLAIFIGVALVAYMVIKEEIFINRPP